MIKYEERHNEIYSTGCYFEDDQIFKDFLDTIEKLKGNEKNYYNAFKTKIKKIVKYKEGVQDNPINRDEGILTSIPIQDGMHIKIIYIPEWDEGQKTPIRYKICNIEVYENATLKKWALKRYLSKK